MRIVLIGLSGAGKSTVGAALATSLGLPFADADALIEAEAGQPIADIFAVHGEPAFRLIEEQVIRTALAERDGVLALGGGAVTTTSVRTALQASGAAIVLLTADGAELAQRVRHAPPRPLLAGDAAGKLAAMAAERAEHYRAVATMTVDTTRRSVREVTDEIAAQLTGSPL